MIELRPLDNVARIQPQTKFLLPDWYVQFSNQWPDDQSFVKGKSFQISRAQTVPYSYSYILAEGSYYDLNMSDEDTGQKLCPYQADHLYELLIGMKPGNYFLQFYFPADQPLTRLDYSTMSVNLADPNLKYLGSVRPEDSPADNPTLKLYLVYKMKPFFIRVVADDGMAYEKATLSLTFNRMLIRQAVVPMGTTPKPLPYLTELQWLSDRPGGA